LTTKGILEDLKVEPVEGKLRRHNSNWLRHVTRMNNNSLPEVMLNYGPSGRRRLETIRRGRNRSIEA